MHWKDKNKTKENSMKNWKTTVCGLVGAIGAWAATQVDPSWLPTVGKILVSLSIAALGFFAKDSNVTGGTVQQ